MKHSSTTLVSVLALAIVTACGGGGGSGGITDLQPVAAASPPPTAERVVTIVGRERAATHTFPAANTIQASSDSVPRIDPLVVHRVQAELDKIERALSLIDDGKVEKHEALEVVRDARMELQKNRPNKLKLRSLLSGLAHGVQMLDGVKSAGDSLGQLVPMV
jgi:hypothetical protein